MPNEEAINTRFIVFGLTPPRLEPTIYRTQGEHANHYATDVVIVLMCTDKCLWIRLLLCSFVLDATIL
jgi:hypothetical protein